MKKRKLYLLCVLLIAALLCHVYILYNTKQITKKINRYAEQPEHQVVTDTYDVLVVEDNVEYYYRINYGRLVFDYLKAELSEDLEGKENPSTLTIDSTGRKRYYVCLENEYQAKRPDGSTFTGKNSIGFHCKADFSVESLSKTDGAGILGKADRYYYNITNKYISREGLIKLLHRAHEIKRDILNQ